MAAAEIDYEGLVSTWIRAIPARLKVRIFQVYSGESLYAETDATPDSARMLAEIASNAVVSAGKALSFSLRALNAERTHLCSYPLKIHFADGEVGNTANARMLVVQAEMIKELMAQNRALHKLAVDSITPVLTGSAAVINATSARAASELQRADAASDVARQAMDVADAAVKQAQEAQASQGSRPMLEKLVIQYVCKELGIDVKMLGPVVAEMVTGGATTALSNGAPTNGQA